MSDKKLGIGINRIDSHCPPGILNVAEEMSYRELPILDFSPLGNCLLMIFSITVPKSIF